MNNKIAALVGVIESADNKPTDQSVEVFNELSAQLDAQIAKMKETLSKQLPLLNAALKREKMDAVDPEGEARRSGDAEAATIGVLREQPPEGGRYSVRWNGTDVVTTRGRNSNAAFSIIALWLCSR